MRGSRIFSRNRGGKGYFWLSGDGRDVRGLVLVISYVNYKKKFEFSRFAHAIDKKKTSCAYFCLSEPIVGNFMCKFKEKSFNFLDPRM